MPEEEKQAIESVYCPRCHLASPAWRDRCIHCQFPLGSGSRRAVIGEASRHIRNGGKAPNGRAAHAT